MRSVVVLPQPDGPSRARNSPGCTSRSIASTATSSPNRFVTPRSSTSGVSPRSIPAEHTERTGRVSSADKRSRPTGQPVGVPILWAADGAAPRPRSPASPPPPGGIARGGREAANQPEEQEPRGKQKELAMDPDRVIIFDTTLRDGEQSPGISLNPTEKLEIAHQLARLGVDVIEAGFPIASPGDFEAVRAIAPRGPRAGDRRPGASSCGRHRRAADAVRDAERPRIHTFISTSDIHIEHQLQSTREDVKGSARRGGAREVVRRRRRVLADGRHARRRRVHGGGAADRARRGRDDDQRPRHGRLRDAGRVRRFLTGSTSSCRAWRRRALRRTATTTSGWPWRTRRPACRPARARSSARSTGSASGPATRRWRSS